MRLYAVHWSFENSQHIELILVKAHSRSHINCGCCKNAVVLAQPSTRRLLWEERSDRLSQLSDKHVLPWVNVSSGCNLHRTRRCETEPVDAVGVLSRIETTLWPYEWTFQGSVAWHWFVDTGIPTWVPVVFAITLPPLRPVTRFRLRLALPCYAAALPWHLVTLYIFIVKLYCTVFVVFILILRKLMLVTNLGSYRSAYDRNKIKKQQI